jgi:lipopolysaccharide export system protein LptC
MKKLLRRKTKNLIIATLAGVVLLIFLLSYSETGIPPTLERAVSSRNQNPDFFIVNSRSSQYDEQGLLSIVMEGDSITHAPDSNTAIIKKPSFSLYKQGRLNWTINSATGTIHNENNQIDLEQQVVITSSDGQTTMKTPALTIFADDEIAVTDKPVTIVSPTGFTRAIGLKANLKKEQIHLLKQVRGQYDAVSP